MNQWIGLPYAINLRIMNREPFLKLGCAMDLPRHERMGMRLLPFRQGL